MESYKTYHFEYEDGNRTEDRKLSSHVVCNIRNYNIGYIKWVK